MSIFFNKGKNWQVGQTKPGFYDKLPAGTYVLNTGEEGFYLTEIELFTLPAKTYGPEIRRHERVINTFLDRPATTGVMLTGEKGAGKTLLAKKISIELAERHGIPTIVINSAYSGDAFNAFMQSITQPVMIMLDEFEKVYGSERQNALLTLLDGTMSSKKLFVIAINSIARMNDFMINRPGRFFYVFNYGGISEEAVREYTQENLLDQSKVESVVNYSSLFGNFTFDMLAAIVQEMNRYNESVAEVLQYINVSMDRGGGDVYDIKHVELRDIGEDYIEWAKDYTLDNRLKRRFNGGELYNPLKDEVYQPVYFTIDNPKGGDPNIDFTRVKLTPNDIKKVEKGATFTFETDEALIVVGKATYEDSISIERVIG
jgi:hypothetical protein